jgi:hypothetical protein
LQLNEISRNFSIKRARLQLIVINFNQLHFVAIIFDLLRLEASEMGVNDGLSPDAQKGTPSPLLVATPNGSNPLSGPRTYCLLCALEKASCVRCWMVMNGRGRWISDPLRAQSAHYVTGEPSYAPEDVETAATQIETWSRFFFGSAFPLAGLRHVEGLLPMHPKR